MCFFYDAENQPWGIRMEHRGHWRVLLTETSEVGLGRREPPPELPPQFRFDVRMVRLAPVLFLPSAETLSQILPEPKDAGETTESLETTISSGSYTEWVSRVHGAGEGEMDHRFLGHPQELQSAMPRELPPITDLGSEDAGTSAYLESAPVATGEWRLLLQLDSVGGPGWMWGDSGRLYFWIPRTDLEAWRFENVWVNLQSF